MTSTERRSHFDTVHFNKKFESARTAVVQHLQSALLRITCLEMTMAEDPTQAERVKIFHSLESIQVKLFKEIILDIECIGRIFADITATSYWHLVTTYSSFETDKNPIISYIADFIAEARHLYFTEAAAYEKEKVDCGYAVDYLPDGIFDDLTYAFTYLKGELENRITAFEMQFSRSIAQELLATADFWKYARITIPNSYVQFMNQQKPAVKDLITLEQLQENQWFVDLSIRIEDILLSEITEVRDRKVYREESVESLPQLQQIFQPLAEQHFNSLGDLNAFSNETDTVMTQQVRARVNALAVLVADQVVRGYKESTEKNTSGSLEKPELTDGSYWETNKEVFTALLASFIEKISSISDLKLLSDCEAYAFGDLALQTTDMPLQTIAKNITAHLSHIRPLALENTELTEYLEETFGAISDITLAVLQRRSALVYGNKKRQV